jgi:large subunit ribosomal protein L10
MAHVANWKKDKVDDLAKMLLDNPVIGVIDIEGIPASQLQQIRKALPSGSKFIVAKNTLIKLALKKASKNKKNINELEKSLDGQRGLIATDINPFRLFRSMEGTKIKAPARGGEAAPDDIEIEEGETSFKPGPIVGELQKAGFPAAIEKGKVIIKKDKLLVKKGDKIPRNVAQMLTRLEIYPMTVGLTLKAGFENELIYTRDVLDVDVDQYLTDINSASQGAFNLSMFIGYPTELTIKPLIQVAHSNAFNLAYNANIPSSGSIGILLAKAQGQALALASHVPDVMKLKEEDKPKEEKKEVPKPKKAKTEELKPKEEKKEVPKPKEEKKEVPKPKEEKKEVPKPKEGPKPKEAKKEVPKPKEEKKEVPKPKEEKKEVPKPKEGPKPKEEKKEEPKPKEAKKEVPKPKKEKKEVPKPKKEKKEEPKPDE